MTVAEIIKQYRVSEATIRNWYKLGYINNLKNISENEIKKIIQNKKSSRRNKKNAVEKSIPQSYLSSASAYRSLEKVVTFVQYHKIGISAIMRYMIEKLLQNKWNDQVEQEMNMIFGEDRVTSLQQERLDHMAITVTKKDDFLGALYMSLITIGNRSEKGIYYTPSKIVDETLSHISFDSYQRILDPACGSGNFLMKAFYKLKRGKKLTDEQIIERLYGFDIDPVAVFLCKINLYYLSEHVNFNKIQIQQQDFLLLDKKMKPFDMIIGNPPWGAKYLPSYLQKLKQQYGTILYKYDSFALFLHQSFSLLQENGVLAFVLPEAILNIAKHEGIRKEILRYHITHIIEVGREFSEIYTNAVILKLRKNNRKEKLVYNDRKVYRTLFFDMPYHSFLMPSNTIAQSILDKVTSKKIYTLKGHATFALGIVTGNNETFLSKTPKKGFEPVITGKELQPYFVDKKDISHYIKFEPKRLQQVAQEELYRDSQKILYKFIGKKLVFSYEPDGILSLNSANVIQLDSSLDPYYIVAMLNSRLTQLYFNEYYRTHKVLRNHIESFPILDLEKRIEKHISKLSKEMIEREQLQPNFEQIEGILYQALSLTEEEISYIKKVV